MNMITDAYSVLLWIMTIAYGLTMSSVYATAFAIPAQNGVMITSRASSAFVSKYYATIHFTRVTDIFFQTLINSCTGNSQRCYWRSNDTHSSRIFDNRIESQCVFNFNINNAFDSYRPLLRNGLLFDSA